MYVHWHRAPRTRFGRSTSMRTKSSVLCCSCDLSSSHSLTSSICELTSIIHAAFFEHRLPSLPPAPVRSVPPSCSCLLCPYLLLPSALSCSVRLSQTAAVPHVIGQRLALAGVALPFPYCQSSAGYKRHARDGDAITARLWPLNCAATGIT